MSNHRLTLQSLRTTAGIIAGFLGASVLVPVQAMLTAGAVVVLMLLMAVAFSL